VAATTAASEGPDKTPPPLILGSASPARQALLSQAGLAFETCPTGLDEAAIKHASAVQGLTAGATALALATAKALAVRRPGAIVIGCDQVLVCEGALFDKPADLAAARQHLQRLRGRPHALETATVAVRDGEVLWRHLETPTLVMRDFSDVFLDWYLAAEGAALLGTVGAYRLEGAGIQLFAHIEGDHSAILGLPLLPLLGFLRGIDIIRR
jgi:septum formation protein